MNLVPTDLVIAIVILAIIGQLAFGLAGVYSASYVMTALAITWATYGLAGVYS